MRTIRRTLFCIALSLPMSIAAQEAPKLVEQIEVRVVNVDVVVTDKKGNRVYGLTKDDFEILENGATQPITNFFEVAPPARLSTEAAEVAAEFVEQQRRRVIVFLDQLSLDPVNRNRVLKQVRRFVDETVRPLDEVMVATYGGRLEIRLPFTDNRQSLQRTLAAIERDPGLGVTIHHARRDAEIAMRSANIPMQRQLIAQNYATVAQHALDGTVEAIHRLMATVAGVEGKKIFLLVTESLPIQPGRELIALLDQFGDVRASTAALQRHDTLEGSTMEPPEAFSIVMNQSHNSRKIIEAIARAANANDITMYPIHAGGAFEGLDTVAEYGRQSESTGLAHAAMLNSAEAMRLVADLTGGVATVGANAFDAAFEKIQDDVESYYSLGYRAPTDKPMSARRVRVRVNNGNYVVRTRREFIDKTPEQEMADQVVANLLEMKKPNELKMTVTVGQPVAAGRGKYRVPVRLQIPMEALTLIPRGDMHLGGFDVFAVVGDAKNAMSGVVRKPHRLTFDETQFAAHKSGVYNYTLDLLVRPGENRLSFAVVDNVSGVQGFGRAVVRAE